MKKKKFSKINKNQYPTYLQKKKNIIDKKNETFNETRTYTCTYIFNFTCQHHSHDPIGFTDRANYISQTSLTSSEATKKPPASWIDSFAREERLLVYTRNDR